MAELRCFEDEAAWVAGATRAIAGALAAAVEARGQATLLLAGGGTPAPVYRALAATEDIPWEHVHFFWGDERHVPPDHEESNFRMARGTLLGPLGIAPDDERVHRIPTESATPAADASLYEQNLRLFFNLGPRETPRFDVVLLGMGDDGHTASLFPDTDALDEREHLVRANPVPQVDTVRITVTFPLLQAARAIFLLVRGEDKAARLAEVIEGPAGRYPVQGVQPTDGEMLWLLDRAAASQLAGGC